MNLLREGVTLSNTKTEQKEMDFNLSNEKQTQFIKAPQDNFIIPRKSGENINFFNNYFSNQQGCDIMSYYYTTQKYFLNSEEDLKIFSFKKESRNFIKKTKLNDFYRKENKNNYNYNGDYINNLDKLNNCIYENKINLFDNKNYNDIRLANNYFFGNNLYLCNNTASKSQNIIYNNKGIFINNNNGEKNSPNNFCDLSKLNVNNNNNLYKNIINPINCPPFIPSNYPKKEKDEFFRKKSEDSLSKDKESDSTSAISEKREEEIQNESVKKIHKKRNTEKNEAGEYLVEMFGRRGWICKLCNNFNYETRIKCNRCGILKKPKKIMDIRKKSEEEHNKEGDWRCMHCKNLNYSFRTLCNRCKIPKMIPFINNNNNFNQFVNQVNLPIFQIPSSLFALQNGKQIINNN